MGTRHVLTFLIAAAVACGGVSERRTAGSGGTGGEDSGGKGGGTSGSDGTSSAGASTSGHGGSAQIDGGRAGGPPAECRSPSEPGCATCCVRHDDAADYCTVLSSSNRSSYDTVRSLSGLECSADCPRCADCDNPFEFDPTNGFCRAECDCTTIAPGGDPCIDESSCGCYCQYLTIFLRIPCPILDPCP
jgi:hypothetical protein